MKPVFNHIKLLVFIAVSALAGCTGVSESARFYTLSPVLEKSSTATPLNAVSVGVGPIAFPRLLDRPQIVTRKSSNEVQLAEFHLWGGSFKEDFARVLADNLATQLDVHAFRYPQESRERPTFQIVISIDRLDGNLGESIEFRGQWQILDFSKHEILRSDRPIIRTRLDGVDYDAYVKGMSQTLATLSTQIADALADITRH